MYMARHAAYGHAPPVYTWTGELITDYCTAMDDSDTAALAYGLDQLNIQWNCGLVSHVRVRWVAEGGSSR